jgi:hypothetical protein
MAQGKIKMPYFKGLNQAYPEIDMSYAADAQNMDISDGVLRVCNGVAKYTFASVLEEVKSLGKLHKRSESEYENILLVATADDVFCWIGVGYYGVKSDLTSSNFAYLNYQLDGEDICIMTNGEDTPFYVDGLYAVDMPDVPKFTDIALHYERMWGAGVSGYPDRVYYSASFDPTDFSTIGETGFIDLPSFDGGSIIAIETLFDDVVVFKSENLYRIIGTYPGTYEVAKIHGVVGPIAGKTVVNTGDMVMFLASEGICVYNGIKAVPFKPKVLQGIYSEINKNFAEKACSIKWGDKILFALPLGASQVNNAIIEYDISKDAFMIRKGFQVESFVEFEDDILFTNGSQYIMQYDIGEDFDTSSIEAFWETPYTDCGDRSAIKYLEYLYAFGKGDSVKISVISEKETKEKTILLNSESVDHIKAKLQGKGVRFKLRFENLDGGYFEIISPEILFEKDA